MLNAIFSTAPLCQVEASSQSQGSSLVKHSYPSFGQSAPCMVYSPVDINFWHAEKMQPSELRS